MSHQRLPKPTPAFLLCRVCTLSGLGNPVFSSYFFSRACGTKLVRNIVDYDNKHFKTTDYLMQRCSPKSVLTYKGWFYIRNLTSGYCRFWTLYATVYSPLALHECYQELDPSFCRRRELPVIDRLFHQTKTKTCKWYSLTATPNTSMKTSKSVCPVTNVLTKLKPVSKWGHFSRSKHKNISAFSLVSSSCI